MPVWEKSSPAGVKDSGDKGTSARVCRSQGREGEGECGGALKRKKGPADAFYSLCVRECVCAEIVNGKPKFYSRCFFKFDYVVVCLSQIIVFIIVLSRSVAKDCVVV